PLPRPGPLCRCRFVLHDEGVLPVVGLHVVHEAVVAFLPPQPVDIDRLAVADRGFDHLRDGLQVVGERVEDDVVVGEQAAHGVGLTLGEASAFGGDGVGQAAHAILAVISQDDPSLSMTSAPCCVVICCELMPLIVPAAVATVTALALLSLLRTTYSFLAMPFGSGNVTVSGPLFALALMKRSAMLAV